MKTIKLTITGTLAAQELFNIIPGATRADIAHDYIWMEISNVSVEGSEDLSEKCQYHELDYRPFSQFLAAGYPFIAHTRIYQEEETFTYNINLNDNEVFDLNKLRLIRDELNGLEPNFVNAITIKYKGKDIDTEDVKYGGMIKDGKPRLCVEIYHTFCK